MNKIGLQCIMFSDWLNMLHELFIVKVFFAQQKLQKPVLSFFDRCSRPRSVKLYIALYSVSLSLY